MLLVITSGQRSPKVFTISAVCGRAPPCPAEPNPSEVPPPPPPTSHDWLSVTNTRALSAGTFTVPRDSSATDAGQGKKTATTNDPTAELLLFISSLVRRSVPPNPTDPGDYDRAHRGEPLLSS